MNNRRVLNILIPVFNIHQFDTTGMNSRLSLEGIYLEQISFLLPTTTTTTTSPTTTYARGGKKKSRQKKSKKSHRRKKTNKNR